MTSNQSENEQLNNASEAEDKADSTLNPEILGNLELANEVAYINLEQQNNLSNNQALFQLKYATVAKCIEVIMSIDPDGQDASQKINTYRDLMDQFIDIFDKMEVRKQETRKKTVCAKNQPRNESSENTLSDNNINKNDEILEN
jgi:CHASE3 domain sensor protein